MIKNIVFDIGNVLVKFGWPEFIANLGFSEEINERIANATVRDDDWNEYDRGVLSDEEILALFIENDLGIESELRAFNENFKELLIEFEYTRGWIKDLQKKGFKVYCLSNMSYKAVRECAALNFLPLLDGYILSCNVKLIKPDPEIYNTLLKTYDLKAEECIFIDDLERNVEAARGVGMHGIVFTDINSAVSEISEIVKSANKDAGSTSRYTKAQRIGALITVIAIALVFAALIVFMIIGTDRAQRVVKILLGVLILFPCLAWAYIWMIGKMTHKDTIADFKFFEDKK